ncbi:FAD-dependent oxidoreductase [Variovorax sp. PBL-E5]|uniref:FAD-dependent oxidoreductase n=1 Tax=Variovorax sp. PBL-E5 TaxID=434014 RepID=UPI001316F5D3|nr:FAD-dependent oxidoreductase [Variovorax sp. PBL-E5]VTU38635.1 3-oxosteroid 1-dehydrogenase [Variovorax sp. PBL-E5]
MGEGQNVDVLVLGAGAAGMTAALAAHARGLKVLLVESSNQVGGTSSTSAGTLWLPCAAQDDAKGTCRDQARAYLEASIGRGAEAAKIDALLDSGPQLLRFLHSATRVRLSAVAAHPDYLQSLPGATLGGRAFAPAEFDGRLLGPAFARIRPPLAEFMVLGGMMVSKADIPDLLNATREPRSFLRAARLVLRHAMDRLTRKRGTRLVMGNALVAQLFATVLDKRIEIAFESTVTRVQRDGTGFSCVVGHAQGERAVRIGKALVLATGGFSGNAQMRERWLPAPAIAHSVAHGGNSGGGIDLGMALGGAVEDKHKSPAFWMPVSTMKRADGSVATFPHIMLDRAKPGLLAVNSAALRFANEADSYHHLCEAMLDNARQTGSAQFYLIADAAFIKSYGIGMVRPGLKSLSKFVASGYLTHATSPAGLAAQLGLDPGVLQGTLARYNTSAASAVDLDFNRGESALNRHNGDPLHTPNPCLRPLDTTALYAVRIHVADLGTSLGLSTDADARVLDSAGTPVPGLYACGNDMASMMRGAYPGPGTTLGPGMTFAWRAARHIASA